MGKARLEAFSDGVLAIVITIMVLELKVPHESSWDAVLKIYPIFLSYVLSFVYIGIYWNNHHHMLHTTKTVSGGILWANLHLLFWLSLVPFTTGWMGENHFDWLPTVAYGVVLWMAGVAYWLLQNLIIKEQGANSPLKKAIGSDWKGKASPFAYAVAITMAYLGYSWLAILIYSCIAMMWFIPDSRIERMYHH